MRRVLMVLGALLAACVPQLATAAPTIVESAQVVASAARAETVRVSVVAHIPVADSLVSDTVYVNTLMHRAVGAVMLGLNESSVHWTDVIVGLQYAKPPNTIAPSNRSSARNYWRYGELARDSTASARTRLRLTRT